MKNSYKIIVETRELRDNLGYLCGTGRTKLKSTLKNYDVKVWIGFIWLTLRNCGGLFATCPAHLFFLNLITLISLGLY
jgi:hypothetical protein